MFLNKVIKIILITLLILFVPYIGMQFSNEIKWTFFDFTMAGFFIFVAISLINFLFYFLKNNKYKYWILGLFVLFFIIIWIELAVGIFNSPFAGS